MKDFGTMYDKGLRAESDRHDAATAARMCEFVTAPTKRDLKAALAEAVRNTAALPVDPERPA